MDVLARRLAAQGLAARDRSAGQVAASFGLQDSPPQAAATALNARGPDAAALGELLERRELVALPNPRTAIAVLPAADVSTYLTALQPPDERALKAVLLRAVPDGDDLEDARDRAVEAVSEALDGRTLSRDALHEELRQRLPEALLPWCPGCKSFHARRGLLTVAALAGRLCIAGREGRQNTFARTDQWIALDPAEDARAEFVRRYLHHLGPSTHSDLAAWAGIAPSHAKELWKTVEDELVQVGKAYMLAPDAETEPPPAMGTRLLGPGDPLLNARDRRNLVPGDVQKRLFRMIASPGLVLHDGRPAGLWRARKQGRKLALETEWLGPPVDVREEGRRLAALRGAELYEA